MITLQTVKYASETIQGLVNRTPLIQSHFLSDLCKGEVFLKLENEQRTSSFKIRGALNRMSQLSPDEREKGVVTASSGNHAQAVALAAEHFRIPATIIVPAKTSKMKLSKISKYNVELIIEGDFNEVEGKAKELSRKEGLTYISPYNDEAIIAGQGTIGIEILEELDPINTIIVPVGGGGLISGIGIAAKNIDPNINILGVQSETACVMDESVKAGKIIENQNEGESIADGLLGGLEEGSITFDLVQQYVDEFILVKESTIRRAIHLLWNYEHQRVEGSGAIGIAAILENRSHFSDKYITSVISGGNIEEELFQEIINEQGRHNAQLKTEMF